MKYNKVVCYDLEMCCWEDSPCGEIIEISLVEVDLVKRIITRSNQYLVTPDNDEVSEFCYQLTGHTNKAVKKQGRSLSAVLETVKNKYSVNKPYIAWGKDYEVLEKECIEKNIDFQLNNPINLALVFNTLHALDKKYSQDNALEMYGLEPEGRPHVAINDARNLARLLLEVRNLFV